jgi:hypothetical protein
VFLCDDGRPYVVKFLSNPQGLRILPNEWWAFQLGRLLGLPMGEAEKIVLAQDLLALPELAEFHLQAGPHYGSLCLTDFTHCSSVEKVEKCTNLEIVPMMIVFDHWINNNDRYCSNRNLLIDMSKSWRLHLIDHGSCFYGAGWTIDVLNEHAGRVETYWGEVYQRFVPFLDQNQPFEAALKRLEALPDHQIQKAITTDIPPEWQVSDEEKDALVRHLIARKPLVRAALQRVVPLTGGGMG